MQDLPACLVLRRFTKNARGGLPVKRTSDLFAWGWAGTEERTKYSALTILSAEANHAACHKPFLFDKLKEALDDVIANKDVDEEDYVRQHRVAHDDAFVPNQNHVFVGDPEKINTKGAPKGKNNKGRGKEPGVTTNDRPKGFDEKPPVRLCGLCRGKGHLKNNCPENPKYVHTISLTFFSCLVNNFQNFDVCYNLYMQEHGMMIIAKKCLNKKNNF